MFIGALGANAIAPLADALRSQTRSSSQFGTAGPDPTTATRAPPSLTTPEPPTDETDIGKGSAKLITELKSLLLGVQSSQGQQDTAGVQDGTTSRSATQGAHRHHGHATPAPASGTDASQPTGALARLVQALGAYAANRPASPAAANTTTVA